MTTPLKQLPAWRALEAHAAAIKATHLRQLFAEDPKRGERLTAEADGIFLDYSKHRITDDTMRLLVALATTAGLTNPILFGVGELPEFSRPWLGVKVSGRVQPSTRRQRLRRRSKCAGLSCSAFCCSSAFIAITSSGAFNVGAAIADAAKSVTPAMNIPFILPP